MDKEINGIVALYREKLEGSGIKVKKIILFGSYAKGGVTEESDIDLVVISDDFNKMDLWDRLCLLGRSRIGIKIPMEILGYTEEEYNKKEPGSFIYDEVKTIGKELELAQ